MADLEKASEASTLSFVGIYGQMGVVPPAGVGGVERAAAQGAGIPTVRDVESERGMDANGGVKTFTGMPGTETDACDIFTVEAGRMKWNWIPVAEDEVAGICETANFYLETVEG